MAELRTKVMSGRYRPITPGKYSNDLILLMQSLLQINPQRRPDLDKILTAPIVLVSASDPLCREWRPTLWRLPGPGKAVPCFCILPAAACCTHPATAAVCGSLCILLQKNMTGGIPKSLPEPRDKANILQTIKVSLAAGCLNIQSPSEA